MADEEPSNLTQDGYLSVETNSKHIIYHPNLNTILVSTAAADVHVIDVNSGVILHKSSLSGMVTFSTFQGFICLQINPKSFYFLPFIFYL